MSGDVLYGDIRLPVRFWEKVYPEPNTGCWLWAGYITESGYGQIGAGRKTFKVHKWMHDLLFGKPAPGIEIDHTCRVRWCVNPDHMELVPKKVNILRGESFAAINARKTQCGYGHDLTGDNLVEYSYPGQPVMRQCRICQRRRAAERRAQKKLVAV